MANRINAAFARMEAQIADRIAKGLTTQDKVDALHKTLDMDIGEHAKFQTLKTLAVARNLLTLEEGQTVFVYLGDPKYIEGIETTLEAAGNALS